MIFHLSYRILMTVEQFGNRSIETLSLFKALMLDAGGRDPSVVCPL